jgi:hypothetical protein
MAPAIRLASWPFLGQKLRALELAPRTAFETAAAMLGDRKRLADAGFYRYLTKRVRVDEALE